MRARRAAFVVPPTGAYVREPRCQGSTRGLLVHGLRPPIDLALDAAILEEADWSCIVLDGPAEGLDADLLIATLRSSEPALVTVQTTVSTLDEDLGFLARVREALPRACLVARGADLGLDPEGALRSRPALDAVVFGDVEAAFRVFAARGAWEGVPGSAWRTGEAVASAPPAGPLDLDVLPFPARHLLHNELYVRPDNGRAQTTVVVTRGCPFRCSYCLAAAEHGTHLRRRSPQSVVAEVSHCVGRFGIRDFVFLADTFTLDRRWVEALCAGLVESGSGARWLCNSRVDTIDRRLAAIMRDAGCWGVALGIESGDEETLRRIGKGTSVERAAEAVRALRDAGVASLGYLMIGFPWDDEARVRRSFEGFLRIDPDVMEVLFPYPFPGTRLREEAVAAGLLRPDERPPDACSMPAFPTPTLTVADLLRLRWEFRLRFMARPRFIARALRRAADPAVLAHGFSMVATLPGRLRAHRPG